MSKSLLLALLTSLALSAPTPQADTNVTASSIPVDTAAAQAEALITANALGAQAGAFPLAQAGTNVSDLGDSLTTFETTLGASLALQDTEAGRGNGAGCAAMTVIFARGTTETGNVGILAGPPFFKALEAMVGKANVDVQGVPYPADIPGFLVGGSPDGSKTMAAMVSAAILSCPNSKVVMSGYSQGGQLVHNAAKILPAGTMAKVDSAVIFGDPDDGSPVQGLAASKTKVICHVGDNICAGGALVLAPHLTYSENAGEAASFVAAVAGLGVGN